MKRRDANLLVALQDQRHTCGGRRPRRQSHSAFDEREIEKIKERSEHINRSMCHLLDQLVCVLIVYFVRFQFHSESRYGQACLRDDVGASFVVLERGNDQATHVAIAELSDILVCNVFLKRCIFSVTQNDSPMPQRLYTALQAYSAARESGWR